MAPEALKSLTPEERHQVYKMLRINVTARLDSCVEVVGDLVCISEGVRAEESDVIISLPSYYAA
jgi:hypothetical protein